jgi:hypothetical protein
MFSRRLLAALMVAGPLILGSAASASTMYTYTGNPFTAGATGSVSGEFTVSSPLGSNFNGAVTPTQFSFSGGQFSLDSSSSPAYVFDIQTSGAGAIIAWFIGISNGLTSIATNNFGDSANMGFSFGGNSFSPGTWSVSDSPSATPLPAALPLFAGGLGALGFFGWRERRKLKASAA